MKKCSWCGAEYPDDLVLCPIDQRELIPPLASQVPKPHPGIRAILLSLRGDPEPELPSVPRSAFVGIIELFLRYIVALVVIVIVFFVLAIVMVGLLGMMFFDFSDACSLIGMIGMVIGGMGVVLAGCLGTFLGALVLPRGKRAFGSIAFLIIGSAYCVIAVTEYMVTPRRDYEMDFPGFPIVAIGVVWGCAALGGVLTALFFNWGRWLKQSRHPQ